MAMIKINTTCVAENDQVEAVEIIGDFAIHEVPGTTAKMAKYRISHIPTGNLAHRGPMFIGQARRVAKALSKLAGYPTKFGEEVLGTSGLPGRVREIYKRLKVWDAYYLG